MQSKIRPVYVRLVATGLASVALAALAGCGVALSTPPTTFVSPVMIQGQVLAGRNYMAGATVKIYVTQPTGVAGSGFYTGTAKLLTTLTANTTGGWSATGITCTSPDQLYVTAEGGTPYPSGLTATTLVNNPNSLMMTAIGDCSILTSATATDNNTSIVTNEASTVAAVWALRNFISLSGTTVNVTSSATNYAGTGGAGIPTNFAGLAHAFLNANNLSPYKLGAFNQYAGNTDGTVNAGLVPVQELNSLAYAQYLCTIGSDGSSAGNFSYCTTLYGLATPPGGTAPSNSLQAMLNIARYPANNAAAILAFTMTPIPLSGQTGAQQINAGVYVPYLGSFGSLGAGGTNDWSVAILYLPPYGAAPGAQGTIYPQYLTIDANDSVFLSNASAATSTAGNVIAISSSGRPLWTTATDTTKLISPRAIAADASGNIWVPNGTATAGSGFVQQINALTGATIAQFPSTAVSLYGIAVDSLGNVWYDANVTTGQNLHELVKNGTTYAEATFPIAPASSLALLQLRPDKNNNIWAAGFSATAARAVYFANTGTAAAPTYTAGLTFATLTGNSSYGITTDANGSAYSATIGTGSGIFKTTVTGTGASAVLTPTSVAAQPAANTRFMDIDGVGNIWYLDNISGTFLYQYIPSSSTLTSFYPCYNAGALTGGTAATCATGLSTKLDLAVDSTGSVWVASYGNSGGGRIAQIIGLAAPTVPLKALGKIGVMP